MDCPDELMGLMEQMDPTLTCFQEPETVGNCTNADFDASRDCFCRGICLTCIIKILYVPHVKSVVTWKMETTSFLCVEDSVSRDTMKLFPFSMSARTLHAVFYIC